MSDTCEKLRRKIGSATELQSVVRTMKALAAANIGQYERAVASLSDYVRTVELGLTTCFRQTTPPNLPDGRATKPVTGALVFGSDQGLVGQFNEKLSDYVMEFLNVIPGEKIVWAVGERIESRLADSGRVPVRMFEVPGSVGAITPLIGDILMAIEAARSSGRLSEVFLFHNRPGIGVCAATHYRLLPLDEQWHKRLASIPWPTINLPEVLFDSEITLRALIREYFFVAIFRACAESLASENASRLSAMQRAEKNIGELLEDLGRTSHQLRQGSIDIELFDLVSGFEALREN